MRYESQLPHVFQNPPKTRFWGVTHGSICIQEGQPREEPRPLRANMQVPNFLQNHPKSWFRCDAHGSIRIQEGEPIITVTLLSGRASFQEGHSHSSLIRLFSRVRTLCLCSLTHYG